MNTPVATAGFLTRKIRISLLALAGIVLFYSVCGFWALPALLRPWLEKQASEALHRQVSMSRIEFNPFLLRMVVRDLKVNEADGPLFSLATLTLDAELASIWQRGPVLSEITLATPKIRLVRQTADRYNFSDLLEGRPEPSAQPDQALPRFSLNNIRILDGSIEFDDRFLKSRQKVSELQLALPFISSLPHKLDKYIEPGLSGRLNGALFKLAGQSKPFQDSHETRLALQLDHLNLPDYLAYVPLPAGMNLPGGELSGQIDLVFRTEPERPRLLLEGRLELADGRLEYRGEPFLTLPAVRVDLQQLEPLIGHYRLARLAVEKPQLKLARNAAGEFAWMKAFVSGRAAPQTASTPQKVKMRVEVADFVLDDGRIDWRDSAVPPGQAGSLEGISVKAQGISTAAGASAPVAIAFRTGHDESFRADLTVQAVPLALDGRIVLDQIQPAHYAAYLKPYFSGELRSGRLSTAFNLHFASDPQFIEISQGEFGLRDLAIGLAREKQPVLKLAALNARGISVNPARREARLASLGGSRLESRLVMGKDGRINLSALLPATPGKAAKSRVPASPEQPAWRVRLDALDLGKSTLRLEDRREKNTPPLVLSGLSLKASRLDSAPASQATLDFTARAGKRGQVRIAGPFVPQPFSARWQIDLRQFDAAFAQPYFTDYLNIQLASIWLGARGALQVATQPKLIVRYRGSLAVNDLHAIDKLNGADFLKWKSLALTGIDAQSDPLRLDLREVALSDFYSRLILSREGRLNLQDVLVREGQAESVTTARTEAPVDLPAPQAVAPAARGPLPPISIGKITLAGGNINYTDNFIQPNFTANLMDMGGVISGLSSKETERASIDLRGSVDRIAPVTVAGSLNPLAQKIFLDIRAAVKGYELTAASTYSAKYAGYGIEKGKLSMDVTYFIDNNQLKASNQLLLDQLTLGEKVESPQATKLPVRFALALLTDRRGQINLNLPVEGSLDDPQFRIGRIIWQVIGNLLEKAVTAPFRALGALFGGDEATFSRVEFEPGQSSLGSQAQQGLGQLARALDDRPGLKLDIIGWVDPATDREGLRQEKLGEKIRARKLAQSAGKGESAETAGPAISEAERVQLLEQVYDREKFPKPRNAIGLQKKLPPTEMEKLILANTAVTDDELRDLGLQRATRVKDALTAAGIDQARLFILKPRLDPPAEQLKEDGGKATRVQFVLK